MPNRWLAEGNVGLTLTMTLLFVLLVQLLLCFKVKKLVLRLLPAILLAVLSGGCFLQAFSEREWYNLGYMLLVLYGGCMLAMCGVGWGIWALVRLVQNSRQRPR